MGWKRQPLWAFTLLDDGNIGLKLRNYLCLFPKRPLAIPSHDPHHSTTLRSALLLPIAQLLAEVDTAGGNLAQGLEKGNGIALHHISLGAQS